jgi:hypothetical protein
MRRHGDDGGQTASPRPVDVGAVTDGQCGPRLARLVALLGELTDDEMRRLPQVFGDAMFARERERARLLLPHVGERCDVIWPGQADLIDVLLVSVDAELGVARVTSGASRQGCDVPAYSVVLRE